MSPSGVCYLDKSKMIKPICCVCNQELVEPGAILFSPPDFYNKVTKKHICKKCYDILEWRIKEEEVE